MESQGENFILFDEMNDMIDGSGWYSITVTSLVTETSQKGSECQANPPKNFQKSGGEI